jgi:hypothetical protein
MLVSLTTTLRVEWTLFTFSIQTFMFLGQCLVNLNIPVPKIGTLHMNPETQNGDLLKYGWHDFDHISVIYEDDIPK